MLPWETTNLYNWQINYLHFLNFRGQGVFVIIWSWVLGLNLTNKLNNIRNQYSPLEYTDRSMTAVLFPYSFMPTQVKFPVSRNSTLGIRKVWLQSEILYLVTCVLFSGFPLNSHVTLATGFALTSQVIWRDWSTGRVRWKPFVMVTVGRPGKR